MLKELHCAYQACDLSVAEIIEQSGVGVGRTTLLRKLKGLTPMTVVEYEALAPVVGLRTPAHGELPCPGRKRKPGGRRRTGGAR